MHLRAEQPQLEFDPQQSEYALALWHAVSGLLELVGRPDGLDPAVDVVITDWPTGKAAWVVRRTHPTDLAFTVERREQGSAIGEIEFTGTDVDHVALTMLQIDRADAAVAETLDRRAAA